MKKQYYYFANLKMFLSYTDIIEFLKKHKEDFITLTKNNQAHIVILPGELALTTTASLFFNSSIKWGGQTCALEENGAYTGQTAALSLAELESFCCLVGHAEVRAETKRTDIDFAHQAGTLLDCMISPIFCIGETKEDMENKKTNQKLTSQLSPLFSMLKKNPELGNETPLFIAYEPIWAIGSGKTPTLQELTTTLNWLKNELEKNLKGCNYKLIYGGSINAENNKELKKFPQLDGFLIGKATLDFQEFKKIVD